MADETSQVTDLTDGAEVEEIDVPYVSPDVAAAEDGKRVEMGKDVTDVDETDDKE